MAGKYRATGQLCARPLAGRAWSASVSRPANTSSAPVVIARTIGPPGATLQRRIDKADSEIVPTGAPRIFVADRAEEILLQTMHRRCERRGF
jgi:hypothetical protein